ncbi:MAG: hypothetical protein ACR2JB_00140 [Bryobacteraceae bacterium]
MMNKASSLGLQIDPEVQKQYTIPLEAEYALDELHTSWKVFSGFPKRRSIPKDAVLANSVKIRLLHDNSWRPPNLSLENGVLSSQYKFVNVLAEPQVAVAGASGAAGT